MSTIMIFITVMLTGLGCGLGCGSLSTPLLVGRMLGEARSTKECVSATVIFSLGKILMYMILGGLSAIFGSAVIENVQSIYPGVTQNVFRLLSIFFGIIILIKVFKKDKCSSCRQCKSNRIIFDKFKNSSYFVIGIVYAVIPCSPLIVALTYAAGMSVCSALLLMLCFGVVNSIFSVIIYAPVVGTIIKRIKQDIPDYYKWIQLFSAVMLIGMSIFIEFN